MGHGGGDEEGGSSERWLVSYADFITLLMVMFVVLYSMGQTDIEKYKKMAESMRNAFSIGGTAEKIVDPKIDTNAGSLEDGTSKPIVVPGIPSEPPKSLEVAGQLTNMLAEKNLGSEVSVQTNIEGVLISLSEKLVFKPGTAELPAESVLVIKTIADMVRPIDNQIRLVGHTDNSMVVDPNFTNNWELSLGRAMVIADLLIKDGIAPERLIVSGRGEYQPVFENDTEQHRALNSRVDIIIIYRIDTNVLGLDTNSTTLP